MREGRVIEEVERPPNLKLERGDNFYDPRIQHGQWKQLPNRDAIEKFYTVLAVCHTVRSKPKGGLHNVLAQCVGFRIGVVLLRCLV